MKHLKLEIDYMKMKRCITNKYGKFQFEVKTSSQYTHPPTEKLLLAVYLLFYYHVIDSETMTKIMQKISGHEGQFMYVEQKRSDEK